MTIPNGPAALTDVQKSAKAIITDALNKYGLGSLGEWAWRAYLQGAPVEQVMLDLRNTPQYKTRFPAMDALAKQGRAISEQTYIDYERSASQLMQRYGIPAGFYDEPADFASLLTGNVSVSELDARLNTATQLAQSDPAVLARWQREHGLDVGHLTAFYLDPKRAQPVLERDFLQAQIGGAADTSGYGLTDQQAAYLASLGVTQAQARAGFGQLAQAKDLFGALPGTTDQAIDQQTQIAAQFANSGQASQAIQKRQAERVGAFSGGTQYAGGQQGYTGVGEATGA